MKYDAEANLISMEIGQGAISHVREFGNFIVHLTESGRPVLIEILDGSGTSARRDGAPTRLGPGGGEPGG